MNLQAVCVDRTVAFGGCLLGLMEDSYTGGVFWTSGVWYNHHLHDKSLILHPRKHHKCI